MGNLKGSLGPLAFLDRKRMVQHHPKGENGMHDVLDFHCGSFLPSLFRFFRVSRALSFILARWWRFVRLLVSVKLPSVDCGVTSWGKLTLSYTRHGLRRDRTDSSLNSLDRKLEI